MSIILTKPILVKNTETSEIDLDSALETLTGQHLIDATTEARALGDKSPLVETSKIYQAVVAAKALGIASDAIINLPAKDFARITMAVASFLLE